MDRNDDDPFGSLAQLCIISDSQEDVLRHCPFAGEPKSDDDSDPSEPERFRVESTGIFMVSPPESLEQKDDSTPHDVYQTPPEESAPADSGGQPSVALDDHRFEDAVPDVADAKVVVESEHMDGATAVDLGRDTDLGLYSEVQLTQQTGKITHVEESIRIIGARGSEVSGSEAKNVGLSSEELSWDVQLGESPPKRLKLSEEALGSGSCTRTIVEKLAVDPKKSAEESEVVLVSSLDHDNEMTEELLMETNGGNKDAGGKCLTERELKFPDELEANCKMGTEIIRSEELAERGLVESIVEKAEGSEMKGKFPDELEANCKNGTEIIHSEEMEERGLVESIVEKAESGEVKGKFPDELEANCKNGTEIIHSEEMEERGLVESIVEKAESSEVKGKFPDELEANCKNGTEIIHSEELEERGLVESIVEKAESSELKGIDDGKCNGDNGEFQRDDDGKYVEKEVGESVKNTEPDKPINFQETTNRHELCRVLPPSINGGKNNASSPDDCREVTILDVLKILNGEEESDEDESLSNVSILEIAKRRGMTFPRPRWWPDGGFKADVARGEGVEQEN